MSATSSVEPLTPTTDAQPQAPQQALAGSDKQPRKRAPRARALTKEDIIEIRALRKYAKWTHDQIAAATPFTINQIQVACRNTPRHKKKPDRWSVTTPAVASGGGPSTGSPLAAVVDGPAGDAEADDGAVMEDGA